MKSVTVKTELKEYDIDFRSGFYGISDTIEKSGVKGSKICVITDDNIEKLYGDEVKKALLKNFKEVYIKSFHKGEKSKNLDTISDIYKFLLENHFDRKCAVAGLGGGVAGDMAGFVAATYMRGIEFIQIPTSLLAEVDSSVGGKTGVDFCGSKNIIGAFYQPSFVYINIDTLKTLPKREFSAGMAEVIKYGIILSKDFYNFISENREKIKNMDIETMTEVIAKCCEFKAFVVSNDEKEKGMRAILNYGHTIGHAVESLKEFELIHGECVGIGMVAAMKISCDRGVIKEKDLDEFEELLTYFDIPVKTKGLIPEDVYSQMFNDKKVSDSKINFVLVDEKIGKSYVTSEISKDEIIKAISYVVE